MPPTPLMRVFFSASVQKVKVSMSNPRKPTVLKLISGTARADRSNKNEPKPQRGIPNPPKHMSKDARTYWRQITPLLDSMGILTIADTTGIEILCECYAEWRQACEALKAYGSSTYETKTKDGSTMFRNRPELATKADCERRIKAMLTEYGLTAASRSKVSTSDLGATENKFAKFGN